MSVQAYEVRRVMRGRLRMTVIRFMLVPRIRMNFWFAAAPLGKALN